MKSLIVSLFLFTTALAFGSGPVATREITPDTQSLITESGQASGTSQEVSNAAPGYTCTAWTQCASGRQIACQATGATCRSDVSQGNWVSCESWGTYGDYARATDSCY